MNIIVSQSLMKDWRSYVQKQMCGLQFKAKYVDRIQFPATDPMLVGIWFEYQATGGKPKSGVVPEPEYLSKGASKGELKATWKYAFEQAERFKNAMEHYQFEIKEVGKKLVTPTGEEGHIDIIAIDYRKELEDQYGRMVPNPDFEQEIIIDLKNTGLMDNKWEDMGWELESLPQKPKLMIQPVHYTWLYKQIYGRYPTFYFFVHSSTNGVESRIIRMRIDPDIYPMHEAAIETVRGAVSKAVELGSLGFKPYPMVKRCSECILREKCDYAITVPLIDDVAHSTDQYTW